MKIFFKASVKKQTRSRAAPAAAPGRPDPAAGGPPLPPHLPSPPPEVVAGQIPVATAAAGLFLWRGSCGRGGGSAASFGGGVASWRAGGARSCRGRSRCETMQARWRTRSWTRRC